MPNTNIPNYEIRQQWGDTVRRMAFTLPHDAYLLKAALYAEHGVAALPTTPVSQEQPEPQPQRIPSEAVRVVDLVNATPQLHDASPVAAAQQAVAAVYANPYDPGIRTPNAPATPPASPQPAAEISPDIIAAQNAVALAMGGGMLPYSSGSDSHEYALPA